MSENNPKWIQPMLATLTEDYFWDKGWIYEEKLDGERILANKISGKVYLYSRNQILQNKFYPYLVKELKKIPGEWWIDGEIVALTNGKSNFGALQKIMHRGSDKNKKVVYFVFDCMYLNGRDLKNEIFSSRKKQLHQLVKPTVAVRLVDDIKDPKNYLLQALASGKEGMIVKNPNSLYESKRSINWLKFKASREQEFVIVGYTKPRGLRRYFGALLVGYFDHGELKYAGKVGTGFDAKTLKFLYNKLRPIKIKSSEVVEKISEKNVQFVKALIVAEIAFTEWTVSGKLRHPRYKGLREDKSAKEVAKES